VYKQTKQKRKPAGKSAEQILAFVFREKSAKARHARGNYAGAVEDHSISAGPHKK